jgi:hypothetical protein
LCVCVFVSVCMCEWVSDSGSEDKIYVAQIQGGVHAWPGCYGTPGTAAGCNGFTFSPFFLVIIKILIKNICNKSSVIIFLHSYMHTYMHVYKYV